MVTDPTDRPYPDNSGIGIPNRQDHAPKAGTIPVYCINMDDRPDRWDHMQAEAAAAGITLIRMPAVDARDPAIQQAAATRPVGSIGLRMGAGSIACFESHRCCWQRLVDSDHGHAMILEDDVLLGRNIAAFTASNRIPADADIVKLETFGTRLHVDRKPGSLIGSHKLHRLRTRHTGAAGYVLSRNAAGRLMEMTRAFEDPVDEILFNDALPSFHALRVYQAIPAPVMQGKREDTVGAQDWAESSLSNRFAGVTVEDTRRETSVQRLRRRLVNEVRAIAAGTRYVVVPYG